MSSQPSPARQEQLPIAAAGAQPPVSGPQEATAAVTSGQESQEGSDEARQVAGRPGHEKAGTEEPEGEHGKGGAA